MTNITQYGYTENNENDPPAYFLDGNDTIVERYLSLPGDVLVTLRSNETDPAKKSMFSLPNIHGDVMATLDANGALLNTHMTGPFGEALESNSNPSNTADGSSYGYVGQHLKSTETDFSIPLIQMGARVYLPSLGRFLTIDPIEGGVDNNYVYPTQPVTGYDLTGEWGWIVKGACKKLCKPVWSGVKSGAKKVWNGAKKAWSATKRASGNAARWWARNDPLYGHSDGILNKGPNRIGFSKCGSNICFRKGMPGSHKQKWSIRLPVKWRGYK